MLAESTAITMLRKALKDAPNPHMNPRWADMYGRWYSGTRFTALIKTRRPCPGKKSETNRQAQLGRELARMIQFRFGDLQPLGDVAILPRHIAELWRAKAREILQLKQGR